MVRVMLIIKVSQAILSDMNKMKLTASFRVQELVLLYGSVEVMPIPKVSGVGLKGRKVKKKEVWADNFGKEMVSAVVVLRSMDLMKIGMIRMNQMIRELPKMPFKYYQLTESGTTLKILLQEILQAI